MRTRHYILYQTTITFGATSRYLVSLSPDTGLARDTENIADAKKFDTLADVTKYLRLAAPPYRTDCMVQWGIGTVRIVNTLKFEELV